MFDGNLRTVDRGLTPIGRSLVKTGIARRDRGDWHRDVRRRAVTIGAGYCASVSCSCCSPPFPTPRTGPVPQALAQAWAYFDSTIDSPTDALRGVAWYLASTEPGRIMMLPVAIMGLAMFISYQQAKAESLGWDARAASWNVPSASSCSRSRCCSRSSDRHPLGDAGPHRHHRCPAVREGLEAGHRRARSSHPSPPGSPALRTRTSVEPLWRQRRERRKPATAERRNLNHGRRCGLQGRFLRPAPSRRRCHECARRWARCGLDGRQAGDRRPQPRTSMAARSATSRRNGRSPRRLVRPLPVESFRLPDVSVDELDGFSYDESRPSRPLRPQVRQSSPCPTSNVGMGGVLACPRHQGEGDGDR